MIQYVITDPFVCHYYCRNFEPLNFLTFELSNLASHLAVDSPQLMEI